MHVDLIFDDGLLRESVDLSKGEGGEFAELFELGWRAIERLAEHCPPRSVRIGRLGTPSARGFQEFFAGLERAKPIEVRAPFEDSDAIAGGAWLGSEHFPNHPDCALAKLCFSAGAVDLPMHSHEHSDRLLLVLEGGGRFHHTPGPVRDFTGKGVRSTSVQVGDVVLFGRGGVHTFSSPARALTLLSWHSPYFAFNDPRQFELPQVRVCPDLPDSN